MAAFEKMPDRCPGAREIPLILMKANPHSLQRVNPTSALETVLALFWAVWVP
jgi:hypothetical protein